jgi:hypothetical protein
MPPIRHLDLRQTLCPALEHARYTLAASATLVKLAKPARPPEPDPRPTSYPYPY